MLMRSLKFLLSLVLCCLYGLAIEAQTITWGDDFNAGFKTEMVNFFEFSDGQSIGILTPNAGSNPYPNLSDVEIHEFDKALHTQRVIDLGSLSWASKYQFEFVFRSGEQIIFFISTSVGSKRELSLETLSVDHRSLKIDKSPTPLYRVEVGPTPISNTPRSRMREFNHAVSQDSTYILIYANVTPAKSESEQFHLSCYTKDLELKWSRVVQTPFSQKHLLKMKWKVDKNANALILGMRYLSPSEGENSNPKLLQHDLLLVKGPEARVQSFPLYSLEHYLHSIDLVERADGSYMLVGLYSDYRYVLGAKGIYSQAFDVKGEKLGSAQLTDLNMEPLIEEFGKMGRGFFVPERKGASAEMSAFAIRRLISRDDGKTILVAEQHSACFGSTQEYLGRASTDETESYHNILVAGLDARGVLVWRVLVPRYQRVLVEFGYFSSVKVMLEPTCLHLLFNDNIDNVPPRRPNDYTNFHGNYLATDKEGALKIITIDDSGKMSGGIQMRSKDVDLTARPLCFVQLAPKRMHIYGQRWGTARIGLLQF